MGTDVCAGPAPANSAAPQPAATSDRAVALGLDPPARGVIGLVGHGHMVGIGVDHHGLIESQEQEDDSQQRPA